MAHLERHGAVVDMTVALADGRLPYTPGQFAFLRFAHDPEPHPFTIAGTGLPNTDPPTAGAEGAALRFAVKALGDYTGDLADRVRVGQHVDVERPYGVFHFASDARREVWVAGGIGITPFLAQLRADATDGSGTTPVDCWYCTRTEQEGRFPADLDALCARRGVTLHRMVTAAGERLSAPLLRDALGGLDDVAIWFCGPDGFARDLTSGLAALGFDVRRSFRREEFRFR